MRHLRRTRRRSGFDRVLPEGGTRLRIVQPVPRADCSAGGGSSGTQGEWHGVGSQGRVDIKPGHFGRANVVEKNSPAKMAGLFSFEAFTSDFYLST